jgi:drug/metabolite transporter (DMT)-like permease
LNNFLIGVLLAILSGICYGFTPILAVYAYQGGATVSDYVSLRYGVASVIILLYLVIFHGRSISKQLGKIPWALPLVAGFAQAIASFLYMSTVQKTTAGLAAILFYTYIIWVAVWGFIFIKERLKLSGVFGIGLALTGLAMLVGVSLGRTSTVGLIMGLGSGLACSGYVMASNRILNKAEPIIVSALISVFTAIPLFLLGSATGTLKIQISAAAWLACAVSGVFTVIALFAFMAGMKRVGATVTSVLGTAEPVTTVVFSALLLSQKMTGLQLIGGMVLLIGAILVVTSKKRPEAGSQQQLRKTIDT